MKKRVEGSLRLFLLLVLFTMSLSMVYGQAGQTQGTAPSGTSQQSTVPTGPAKPIPTETLLKDFDTIWQSINDAYVDPKFNGVDWSAMKDKYRPQIQKAPDAQAAYKLFAEMLATLKDDNTFVVPSWLLPPQETPSGSQAGASSGSGSSAGQSQGAGSTGNGSQGTQTQNGGASSGAGASSQNNQLEYAGVGILLQQLQSGDVMVLQVFKGTPAEAGGVLVGDVIVKVNDWKVGGDNPVQGISDRVRGPVGTDVTLTLRDPAGKERTVTLTRAHIDLRPSVESRVINNTIGYLRIPVLSADLVQQASTVLPSLLSTDSMILDLRSVQSGSLDSMIQVAQWFLGAAQVGGFLTHDGPQALPYRADAITAYYRRLIVLTNPYTYGVAEILTMLLQEYQRATIVGGKTEGGFAITKQVQLPSGGLLQFTVGLYASPKGNVLPSDGIKPDVAVPEPDLATVRAGKDVYLDKALEILKSSP